MISRAAPYSEAEAQRLGILELAYVGDSVCDLYVREQLIPTGLGAHDMHLRAVRQVNAKSPAEALQRLLPGLTETEAAIVRRGKNAKAHHAAPQSAGYQAYSRATALEALLGYLYLSGQDQRLLEVLQTAMEISDE